MLSTYADTVSFLEKIEESALIQLVYISDLTIKARLNASVFAEVESQARMHNEHQGITGVLCYGSGQFIQCIEGPKAQVLALQQRIFADQRHKNTTVLLARAIDERSFTDWRMRLIFLERWLWSAATKKQAEELSLFLPFRPRQWTPERTELFLQTIQDFDNPPHIKAVGITYNAIGNMIRHIAAPHQAFLIVQGVLTLLLIIAIFILFL